MFILYLSEKTDYAVDPLEIKFETIQEMCNFIKLLNLPENIKLQVAIDYQQTYDEVEYNE